MIRYGNSFIRSFSFFIRLFFCYFVCLSIRSFIHLFVRSFIHLFVRSFIYSFIHYFIPPTVKFVISSFIEYRKQTVNSVVPLHTSQKTDLFGDFYLNTSFSASRSRLAGIDYKPPTYKEHDFSEAPKFTTGMPDRSTTVGYNAKLLCSVRGCPKVSITSVHRWTQAHKPHTK